MKQLLKYSASKVYEGAMLGIGIVAIFLVVEFCRDIYVDYKYRIPRQQIAKKQAEKQKPEKAILSFKVSSEKRGDGYTIFIGKILNKGNKSANHLEIYIDFFKDGKFVDMHHSYCSKSIPANSEINFKIQIGSTFRRLANYDDYKINIEQ